ncbi:MAG: hypothetical protein IJR83_01175 [Clostridia bacterium]|nr:hypothetical protein [Clostridia bacterium]
MKKALAITLLCCMLLAVCASCSAYTSTYSAVGFVHSNTSSKGVMNFYTFKGTMVFKLKCDGAEGRKLVYEARLESGNIRVSCDSGAGEETLFSVGADGNASGSLELHAKGTVYVIVRADEKCTNGDLSFTIE